MERFRQSKRRMGLNRPYESICARRTWISGVAKMCVLLGVGMLALAGCSEPDRAIEEQGSLVSRAVSRETAAPPPEVRDLTKDGCPPELLAQARAVADGSVVKVRDGGPPWSTAKYYMFWTDRGKYLEFMPKGDTYIHVNSPSGIGVINDLLQEYEFTRHDFGDPEEVHWFLEQVVGLYGDRPGTTIGSSVMLRISEADGGISLWLEGTEKSEEAFLELCRDPQFRFEGSKWEVAFHVFKQGGSVERWEVKGEFDARNECNKIHTVDITLVKPKGTFYHEVMGRSTYPPAGGCVPRYGMRCA